MTKFIVTKKKTWDKTVLVDLIEGVLWSLREMPDNATVSGHNLADILENVIDRHPEPHVRNWLRNLLEEINNERNNSTS